MDAVSYSHSAKQAQRIEKFIKNPDSDSGIVTVPKVIGAGENITIPAGRVAVLPNVQVDGTLNVEGEVFIPSGSTFGDLEDQIALKADTSYVNSKYSGFKNYIINGNFDVWQRGTSETTAVYGSDDRWRNVVNGSTKTHSRIACTDTERAVFNASYFSRTVVTSVVGAMNFTYKSQSIENVTKLAGKTITISFWARADSNKNISLEFIQNFGTGGSPSDSILGIGITTIRLTSTWQKKIVTVTIPSLIGKTLGSDGVHTSSLNMQFWFESGSNFNSRTNNLGQQSGTFDIAQVQLEEGSVATPFEQRPYGLELSLCQRYYWKTDNGGMVLNPVNAETNMPVAIKFPVSMRVVPTETRANGYLAGITKDFSWGYVTCPPLGWGYVNEYTVDAEL